MRSSRFAVAASIGLAFALCGCSRSETQDNSGAYTIHAESFQDAMDIVQSANVYCKNSDGSGCTPSVGMYVAISRDNSVMQCTAFLISPRVAITNSHCIPSDLKTAGSSCSGRVWIDFPGLNGGQQTNVGCNQVLFASSIPDPDSDSNEIDPDYAVIQLGQTVANPPLALSREGFENQRTYELVKVDPQSHHAAIGAMETASCTAVHESLLIQDSGSDNSANMTFGDCTVIHGNSGSPILDQQGNARGLIQALFEPNSLGGLALEMMAPQLDSGVAPLGIGTNFACLDFPDGVSAAVKDPACAKVRFTSSPGGQVEIPSAVLHRKLRRKLSALAGDLDPTFQWTWVDYRNDNLDLLTDSSEEFITVPQCIQDSESLLKDEAQLLGGYSSKASRNLELQIMTVQEGLNKYLAPDVRLDPAAPVFGTLIYDPNELARNGRTKASVTVSGISESDLPVFSQVIGVCEN